MEYLIANKEDFDKSDIKQFDFIMVSGDAYVDHPSFGVAIIGRLLEKHGFKVGIIPQPDWNDLNSFKIFGKPKYGFLVSSGNIDSMVNHYTVAKNRRKKDFYTPKGEMGRRPDRATIVYSNKLRECYGDVPIIIGGVEASLRRLAHYDYWDNKIRNSILVDSQADILVYGMGENQIIEIAENLKLGINIEDIKFVEGTVVKDKDINKYYNYIMLPTISEIKKDKRIFGQSYATQFNNLEYGSSKTLIEPYKGYYVIQNIRNKPLTTEEFDKVYKLNFMRDYHPMYEEQGGIPAITEVKYSIISNRGCYGSCEFCAITFHQGRTLQSRSHESILKEAVEITEDENFKGYIHDVGGPTANFRIKACDKQEKFELGACAKKKCLGYKKCNELKVTHDDYVELLKKVRSIDKIKKVFVRSGIRYDYAIYDKDTTFLNELVKYHISGQLKVAPEHVSNKVLRRMGKPPVEVYNKFTQKYNELNKKYDKNQFLVPYLMSSHPASDLEASIELAEYLRDLEYMPEQVQDFYPTPGTLSTCIYYTGEDPFTFEKVYVAKKPIEKATQRALIQYRLPQNYMLVHNALVEAGREDLIGFDKHCLIRPKGTNGKRGYYIESNKGKKAKNDNKSKRNKRSTETKNDNRRGNERGDKINRENKDKFKNKENNIKKAKTYKKKTIRNVHKKKGN